MQIYMLLDSCNAAARPYRVKGRVNGEKRDSSGVNCNGYEGGTGNIKQGLELDSEMLLSC